MCRSLARYATNALQSWTSPAPPCSTLTLSDAASAVNAVQNHPITQNLANGMNYILRCARTLADPALTGPAATSVKNQAAATGNELSGLANSRQTPSYTAANGETLTRKLFVYQFGNHTDILKTITRSSTPC